MGNALIDCCSLGTENGKTKLAAKEDSAEIHFLEFVPYPSVCEAEK
jgi:hypothetical protein